MLSAPGLIFWKMIAIARLHRHTAGALRSNFPLAGAHGHLFQAGGVYRFAVEALVSGHDERGVRNGNKPHGAHPRFKFFLVFSAADENIEFGLIGVFSDPYCRCSTRSAEPTFPTTRQRDAFSQTG